MNISKSTFSKRLIYKALCPVAAVALTLPLVMGNAQAATDKTPRSAPISGFLPAQAWHGQRPLLLLPLQYGSDFNLDQKQFAGIASYAEQAIQAELQETGKLSVFQVSAHSPALMRGVLDEKVTQDQVDTLVKSPTLENANTVLSGMQFDKAPLIAVFSLGKVTTYSVPPRGREPQPPVVQAEVTGKLYELNNTTPVKTVVMTSDLHPRNEQGFWTNDRILLAIDNAAAKVAEQFVAPVQQVDLPTPVGPAYPGKTDASGAQPITWVEPVKPKTSKG